MAKKDGDSASQAPSSCLPTTNTSPRCNQCQICAERFPSRNRLFAHLRQDHADQFSVVDKDAPHNHAHQRTAASLTARLLHKNPHYEAYYRLQCEAGVMSHDAFNTALQWFQRPLPVAFRIHHSNDNSAQHEYHKWMMSDNGFLKPSPFVSPDSCRVAQTPPREWSDVAQRWLADGQEVGAWSRQEVCSMIPPLLLLHKVGNSQDSNEENNRTPQETRFAAEQTQPLRVLDLCAAPGSKTLQMLSDVLQSNLNSFVLVANDTNRSRLLTVCRRSRLHNRQALLLNCSDGRYFPALRQWGGYKFKFTHILCDAPCSGDGTLRKNPAEWKAWNVKHHLSLHKLQLALLKRALAMVDRHGGRVVYSTCSLDPIENEAVVAAAVQQSGGPDLFRVVPPPEYLEAGATQPFPYQKGATRWVVPHPDFGVDHKVVYTHLDEVPPEMIRTKRIVPSMFPPRAQQHESDNVNMVNRLEEMLANCCRILPQHLDSGGFFCAILERVPLEYYAVSCPLQRGADSVKEEDGPDHNNSAELIHSRNHGRIYQSSDAVHVRRVLAEERQTLELCFEGFPTLALAQRWQGKHGAFVEGVSEVGTPIELRKQEADMAKEDGRTLSTTRETKKTKEYKKPPLYTPLYPSPHPDLVIEFCQFFGLCITAEQAEAAGVERFPVENMVAVGGGANATNVTSCHPPSLKHLDAKPENGIRPNKVRYTQLTLVSPEIKSLFAGGAKFSPVEAGMALCSVPVTTSLGDNKRVIPSASRTPSRAETSGRYGLMDEAVEFVGRCATKRVVALTQAECLMLLTNRSIRVGADGVGQRLSLPESNNSTPLTWWDKWKKHRTAILDCHRWTDGGVVVVCSVAPPRNPDSTSTLFLSCTLPAKATASDPNVRVLELLTEQRLVDAWIRLLRGA